MGWDRAFPLIILIIAVASAYYGTIKSRSCSSNYHLHSDLGLVSYIEWPGRPSTVNTSVCEWVSERSLWALEEKPINLHSPTLIKLNIVSPSLPLLLCVQFNFECQFVCLFLENSFPTRFASNYWIMDASQHDVFTREEPRLCDRDSPSPK